MQIGDLDLHFQGHWVALSSNIVTSQLIPFMSHLITVTHTILMRNT